jgi:hypothetical protein
MRFCQRLRAVLHGQDIVPAPKATTRGVENAVTLADRLAAAEHILELRGRNLQELISAVRIYAPTLDSSPKLRPE